MKIKIRRGVFETNSSSVHSIAIPKNRDTNRIGYLSFRLGEFGWSFNQADPCDYLYTGIIDAYDHEEAQEKLDKLKQILSKHGIDYKFQEVNDKVWYFVDHADELIPLIEELLNDEDKLLRFLNGGLVFTGNDNEDCSYVRRDKRTYYDYDYNRDVKNPFYMDDCENYDWYYKGN